MPTEYSIHQVRELQKQYGEPIIDHNTLKYVLPLAVFAGCDFIGAEWVTEDEELGKVFVYYYSSSLEGTTVAAMRDHESVREPVEVY